MPLLTVELKAVETAKRTWKVELGVKLPLKLTDVPGGPLAAEKDAEAAKTGRAAESKMMKSETRKKESRPKREEVVLKRISFKCRYI